jgi:hypothetical protein
VTKYKALDLDEVFVVDTPEELVSVIRSANPFLITETDEQFMVELSDNLMLQSGAVIRTDTASNFVEDLITAGFLKEVLDASEEN